jgi:hypothetical protein
LILGFWSRQTRQVQRLVNRYEASKDLWVACGIALRAPVKDLKSLAVAACEIAVAQNGEGADFVPRGLDFWYVGQRSFVLPC